MNRLALTAERIRSLGDLKMETLEGVMEANADMMPLALEIADDVHTIAPALDRLRREVDAAPSLPPVESLVRIWRAARRFVDDLDACGTCSCDNSSGASTSCRGARHLGSGRRCALTGERGRAVASQAREEVTA